MHCAGHQSYPVYNLDGSLQGHVTVADGVDLDAAGLQAVYADGVAQGYPIDVRPHSPIQLTLVLCLYMFVSSLYQRQLPITAYLLPHFT